jgi:hypothetical protein
MQRLRGLGDRIRQDPPQTTAIVLAALAFLAVCVYAFGSDVRELACNRLQDDSYYYLEPAWNFSRTGMVSFDGEHPTYGFQPLWMIVLAMLARLSPDKIFFLRAVVALGGLFFCLTGFAVYRLARGWFGGAAALIAPVLWTANPSLLGAYISGKENALYAFLLVAACLAVRGRVASPARSAWAEGAVLGVTVLARVNAIVPAALFLLVLGLFGAGGRSGRARKMLTAGAGMLAVLAVWGVYAQISFGALVPNSGTAKLFGAGAALATFVEYHLPFLPHAWIEGMVPPAERILLTRPDLMIFPDKGVGISYLFGLLPDLAFGSWAGMFSFLGAPDFRLKAVLLALIGIGAVGWVVWKVRIGVKGTAVIGALILAAAINSVTNWLLLPDYLLWGVWYTVPETITLILGASFLLAEAVSLSAHLPDRIRPQAARILLLGAGILGAAGLARLWAGERPRAYAVAPDRTQQEMYDAALWMNANLPVDARVGSYSAGLIGYFCDTCRVINLDGLANTPGFIDDYLAGHILFLRGLAAEDPIRAYLAEERIAYLANVDPVGRIAAGDYLGLVEPGEGVLLYQGEGVIVWGPGQPERRMIVVKINP